MFYAHTAAMGNVQLPSDNW